MKGEYYHIFSRFGVGCALPSEDSEGFWIRPFREPTGLMRRLDRDGLKLVKEKCFETVSTNIDNDK